MDYAEYYYGHLGVYPFETERERIQTQNTIAYMEDSGISESEILSVLEDASRAGVLLPSDLPDWLWEGSLVERDVFYYHSSLHIKSAPPVFDPITSKVEVTPYFMEMKIRYTIQDLVRYFYKTTRLSIDLCDEKKDEGALRYLLGKYQKLSFCEPLDFVLSLIDEHGPNGKMFSRAQSVIAIEQAQAEVYEKIKRKTAEARLQKADRIIWR